MGSCIKSSSDKNIRIKEQMCDDSELNEELYQHLSPKQIYCLKLIYQDLSIRNKNKAISIADFASFFHLSFQLAESLYSIFAQNNQSLTQKDFINNFQSYISYGPQKSIHLLFQVLNTSGDGRGLSRSQLHSAFMGSPHETIKQIINNNRFIDSLSLAEMSEFVFQAVQNQQAYEDSFSIFPYFIYKRIHSKSERAIEMRDQGAKLAISKEQLSYYTKQNFKKLIRTKLCNSLYGSRIISRYLKYLFQLLKIKPESDRINQKQFKLLAILNPIIFDSLFSGFHEYLWKHQNGFPQYKTVRQSISDYATQKIEGIIRSVYISLRNTSLLIFTCQKMSQLIGIKNLQGLFMKPIQSQNRYGFMLYQLDGKYPQTEYYFQKKDSQLQWTQNLKWMRQRKIETKYKICEKIKVGTNSQIFQCQNLQTKVRYILKVIKKQTGEKQISYFQHQFLALCHHENIISIKQYFQTKKYMYLVLEKVEDINIGQHLSNQTKKINREQQIRQIMQQILAAVDHIHSLGLIHLDIRAQNVLIKKDERGIFIPKLTDFARVNFNNGMDVRNSCSLMISSRTALYNQQNSDLRRQDLHQIGSLMFYLICQEHPGQGNVQFNGYSWNKISNKCKDLIRILLNNTERGFSCKEALRHEWFK